MSQLEEPVARIHQGFVTDAAQVEQLYVKARRCAQPANRRWHEHEDTGVANLAQGLVRLGGDGLRAVGLAGPFGPIVQPNKGHARILSGTGEAEPCDGEDVLHVLLRVEVFLNLPHHRFGALQSRPRRELNHGDHRTLILVRQERGGHAREQQGHYAGDHEIDQHHPAATMDQLADPALVATGRLIETAVKPAEEALAGLMAWLRCLEQRGA